MNFSPAQFRDAAVIPLVLNAISTVGLAPDRLEIEITETLLLSDNEAALDTLKALAKTGVRLALDDFGTGYSSLSYLRKLPLQKIKIDRSFIRDLLLDADSASIVKSIIAPAADLRIATTAEGVETDAQLAWLRTHR